MLFAVLLVAAQLESCQKQKPAKPVVQKPRGTLIVIGAPEGAILVVDEKNTYPLGAKSRLKLPIGEHRVSIECQGYFPMYQIVTIKEQEETSLTALLQPSMPD
jgi:hypothetical protein